MLLRFALVVLNACYVSSSLVTGNEGFEEVSDIVEWIDNFVRRHSFLRGTSHTGLNTEHDFYETLDEDFDHAWGEDFDKAWDENIDDDTITVKWM